MNTRNTTIDLIKGISIIAIVFGHAFNTDTFFSESADFARRFVYLFHLTTFFFASGYTFKKYDVKIFVKKKLLSLYIPFVFIELFSLALYPAWRFFDVIDSFTPMEFIKRLIRIFLFSPSGIFEGAIWFIPTLFFALMIYFFLDYFNINNVIKISLIALLSFVGYLFLINYIGYALLNISLLVLPFIYLGHLSQKYNLIGCIKPMWIALLASLMFFISGTPFLEIEISKKILANGWFHLISLIGILFCISIAKVIEKSATLTKLLNYISVNSFNIMAFHFIIFKSIDVTFSQIIKNNEALREFPISYPELRPFYFILGIILSMMVGKLINPFMNKAKNITSAILDFI